MKLPNGNALLLTNEARTREEAIAAGANPDLVEDDGILVDYIVEIRPDGPSGGGEVVWEWRIWDHLVQDYDPGKANYGDVAQSPELIDINFTLAEVFNKPKEIEQRPGMDWTHANSLDYNPELDQIMLSPRHFSEVWIIDHSTTREEAAGHTGGNSGKGGDLLYRWGNPRAYRAGTASDQQLFWQHQPHWIPPGLPGEGNILIFNNGNEYGGFRRGYSSVVEIVPPVDGYNYQREQATAYGPAEPVWTYTAETPGDFYAPIISGAQRLPNGNTHITAGTQGTLFEVTPGGDVAAGAAGGVECPFTAPDGRAGQVGMPKIRCPTSSASVCRTFSGARLSARHPANALTRPYTRSAALSRTPPSELACSRLNVATRGLSKRSGNRTVYDILSGVTQGSPLWLNACDHNVCTTRRLRCLPQNHHLHG